MKKSYIYVLSGIIILLLAGLAGYSYLVSPTKAPSQPSTPARPTMKPLAPATTTTAAEVTTTQNQTLYAIVTEGSTATFTLDEMLRGEPKTVVGTSTGYIAGEIGLDKKNMASSTIGEIRVNARTFITDDNSRNNMTRRAILKTEDDANEFIIFTPSSIVVADKNSTNTFDIMGDLRIAGVTKPATFHATTILAKDGTLTAHVTATVKRADFNLTIPNIPFIANVEDTVDLALDFTASPVTP